MPYTVQFSELREVLGQGDGSVHLWGGQLRDGSSGNGQLDLVSGILQDSHCMLLGHCGVKELPVHCQDLIGLP